MAKLHHNMYQLISFATSWQQCSVFTYSKKTI